MIMLSNSAVLYAFMICSEKSHYRSGIYCACHKTRAQVEEIMKSLCELFHDRILRSRFSSSDKYVIFKNDSIIRLCPANDSSRGQRFNLIIFDKEIEPIVLRNVISPSDRGDKFEYDIYHYEKKNSNTKENTNAC